MIHKYKVLVQILMDGERGRKSITVEARVFDDAVTVAKEAIHALGHELVDILSVVRNDV